MKKLKTKIEDWFIDLLFDLSGCPPSYKLSLEEKQKQNNEIIKQILDYDNRINKLCTNRTR